MKYGTWAIPYPILHAPRPIILFVDNFLYIG